VVILGVGQDLHQHIQNCCRQIPWTINTRVVILGVGLEPAPKHPELLQTDPGKKA
jgi:hypothetical protein